MENLDVEVINLISDEEDGEDCAHSIFVDPIEVRDCIAGSAPAKTHLPEPGMQGEVLETISKTAQMSMNENVNRPKRIALRTWPKGCGPRNKMKLAIGLGDADTSGSGGNVCMEPGRMGSGGLHADTGREIQQSFSPLRIIDGIDRQNLGMTSESKLQFDQEDVILQIGGQTSKDGKRLFRLNGKTLKRQRPVAVKSTGFSTVLKKPKICIAGGWQKASEEAQIKEDKVHESCDYEEIIMKSEKAHGIDRPQHVGLSTRPKIRAPLLQRSRHITPLEEASHCLRLENEDLSEEGKASEMVRHTLKRFEDLRRKLLRDAESRSEKSGIVVKRPDFKAASILKASALYLNQEKRVGHVPGIEVGDQFYFRIELCIVGLHRPLQAGIDAIHAKDSEYGIPVAASIVASGGYEDDLDTGETLIYTGQGGNNYKGDRRQQKHQRLEKGNLALANSCRKGLPVRLIRGCNDTGSSPTGKIYSYDGLYKVARFWLDMGLSGYGVYKFQLHRLPGQPPLGSALVQFMGKLKTTPSGREAMILKDISNGAEKLPLCVVNTVDRSPEAPADFRYITSIVYPSTILRPSAPKGCQCKDGCFDPFVCRCIRKNSGELPYTHDGALVELKNVVYECGEQCQCPPSCHTRVSQHGQKHRLEIFKTDRKGWGVRSWDSIPSGSFICEYMGELISSEDAENLVGDDEYLFDLDCIKGNEARGVKLSLFNEDAGRTCEEASLAINARKLGNVGRFINHSCSPNLFVQCVLYDHHDLRIPHIMLFAMENIRPLKELTYDYAYVVGTVIDADGKVKSKACHCGAKRCRGRLY